jgi:hypothetical protein
LYYDILKVKKEDLKMHKHTVIVPKKMLNTYLEERRLTIGKAQKYLNDKESQRVNKQLAIALAFGIAVVIGLAFLISL